MEGITNVCWYTMYFCHPHSLIWHESTCYLSIKILKITYLVISSTVQPTSVLLKLSFYQVIFTWPNMYSEVPYHIRYMYGKIKIPTCLMPVGAKQKPKFCINSLAYVRDIFILIYSLWERYCSWFEEALVVSSFGELIILLRQDNVYTFSF